MRRRWWGRRRSFSGQKVHDVNGKHVQRIEDAMLVYFHDLDHSKDFFRRRLRKEKAFLSGVLTRLCGGYGGSSRWLRKLSKR